MRTPRNYTSEDYLAWLIKARDRVQSGGSADNISYARSRLAAGAFVWMVGVIEELERARI